MADVLERAAGALRGESVQWGENYAGLSFGPSVSFHDATESMYPSADDVLGVLKTYRDTAETFYLWILRIAVRRNRVHTALVRGAIGEYCRGEEDGDAELDVRNRLERRRR